MSQARAVELARSFRLHYGQSFQEFCRLALREQGVAVPRPLPELLLLLQVPGSGRLDLGQRITVVRRRLEDGVLQLMGNASVRFPVLARHDGENLAHHSFAGCSLLGASFVAAVLDETDLRGARCQRADFSNASLIRADLRGADLSRANLQGANLLRANLGGAVLERARLLGASLSGADIRGADLTGARLDLDALDGAFGDASTTLPLDIEGAVRAVAVDVGNGQYEISRPPRGVTSSLVGR